MNYLSHLRRVVVTFAVGVAVAAAAVIAGGGGGVGAGAAVASYFPGNLLTYGFIIICDHQMPFMSRIVITR